ncbi:DUF5954 family protein [Streptomyces sp. NPDC005900]|uniref:DUF5954 family protein n=1 Tax=Streptomyces sp. NPDC005900 TaxID=3154569 RepID=UPI00341192C5
MTDDWKRQLDQVHAGLVRRDDPAELVTEADAVDASYRYPQLAVRGPVFGLAVQDPAVGPRWRVVAPVVDGMPQQARDALNSMLWFKAKDDTDDPAVRRDLLAAVAILEREPVNEVEVRGARYRVVRGDEFARSGADGLEPPRPTDPEPVERKWSGRHDPPSADLGFVLDPAEDTSGLMTSALKLGLREFAYTGARFPVDVRADSVRAIASHPDILLMPVGFGVSERGTKGWKPVSSLMPTPHDARRLLYDSMTDAWPMLYRFSPEETAEHARAAEEFKALGRANEVRVADKLYRICRTERLVRVGPDGPEPPRPSDQDSFGPMQIHPTMDEDGTIHPGD